jgi:FdhD protein
LSGPIRTVSRRTWLRGQVQCEQDEIVVETPVALVYNGISHAVMMATPTDLEDFALGFSLSEGILDGPEQFLDMEVREQAQGIELAITIATRPFVAFRERRRSMIGPSGCGLCGIETLAQALPAPTPVHARNLVSHAALQAAVIALGEGQPLKGRTGGVHGAAWCNTQGVIELVREDVGRHNALDKLLGALCRRGQRAPGFVLVTSRASYEMVAKATRCGVAVLAAVSAPTSLAVEQARISGLTLVGLVQPGRQVVYTHPGRMVEKERKNSALVEGS